MLHWDAEEATVDPSRSSNGILKREAKRNLEVAFVNNMPPSAFAAAERQFLGLVAETSPIPVTCRRFVVPHQVAEFNERQIPGYFDIENIYSTTPDAVIVTGGAPHPGPTEDEPSWDEMARLLEWACNTATVVVASCLAAHAAVALFDGLDRRRLKQKQTGVLLQAVRSHTLLTEGLPAKLHMPQSRFNDVPTELIQSAGYQIHLASVHFGWTVASKRVGHSELVLMQGHPEYDPSSLLLEYRRDVRRWLEHAQIDIPRLPNGCAAPVDMRRLEDFHSAILANTPVEFPDFELIARRATASWRPHARRIYHNWMGITRDKVSSSVA